MLIYKFKKEEIDTGWYICKPTIKVEFEGRYFFPILDSGCDITVISEGLADLFGIQKGEVTELKAFRESFKVYRGFINLKLISNNRRFKDEVVTHVPCLIVPKEKIEEDDAEMVIGVAGIFERFKITFDLPSKKIILKMVHE